MTLSRRIISPDRFGSPILAQLSIHAEDLFCRLLHMADDYGAIPMDTRRIVAELYSNRDGDGDTVCAEEITETHINDWLTEIMNARSSYHELPLLVRIEYRGRRYLIVRSWNTHQKITPTKRRKHRAVPCEEQERLLREALAPNTPEDDPGWVSELTLGNAQANTMRDRPRAEASQATADMLKRSRS